MFQEMKPPLYHLPQNIHEPGSADAIKQEEDDAKFKVQDIVVLSKVTSGYPTSIIFNVVQLIRSGDLKVYSLLFCKIHITAISTNSFLPIKYMNVNT